MVPPFQPIPLGSLAFGLLILVLIAAAWSAWLRTRFLGILILVNAVLLGSWIHGILELAGLALFVVPPYLVARAVWNTGVAAPRWLLAAIITSQILFFFVFRHYPGWDFMAALGHPVTLVGVSYIMFRQLHVVLDAPYSSETFSPWLYIAYVTSIWTLFAGPIQRYQDFVAGLPQVGRPKAEAVLRSAHRVTTGLLKAFVLAPVFFASSKLGDFNAGDAFNPLRWGVAFYSYFIFLYLDFSGYTDIVIGAAQLCGFNTLPENFNRPYLSANLQEFWTRWHMSLGTWFRDYFYTPVFRALGEQTRWRSYFLVNVSVLILTFLLVGAWHGPGLNFVVFGVLQAVGVAGAVIWREIGENNRSVAWLRAGQTKVMARVICFHYVCGSFLFLNNSVDKVTRFFGAFAGWLMHS